MTPIKKTSKAPDIKDPVLRSVWRRFGLHPPPLSSPPVTSSCSIFSNVSNDLGVKRGWQESDEGPIRPIEAASLKISGSECNGLSNSCQRNSDLLDKSCVKLDIIEAQDASPPTNGSTQAASNGASKSSFLPVFLPIDRKYETKYMMHKYRLGVGGRRGRTFQEKTYLFLEHPCGWIGFSYHMSV